MNARTLSLALALIAVVSAGWYHFQVQRDLTAAETERTRALAETEKLRQASATTAEQTQRMLERVRTEAAARAERTERRLSSATPQAAASNTSTDRTPAKTPASRELREMQVEVGLAELRLNYSGLLTRLNFSPEKQQAFYRIMRERLAVAVDETQPPEAREHSLTKRNEQLKELFGADHEQWQETVRMDASRAIVAGTIQQTFQSADTLSSDQVEELTKIVYQHRPQPGKTPRASVSGRDWDAIVADAGTVLNERQREAFATAIEYRRLSEQMSALAAQRKK